MATAWFKKNLLNTEKCIGIRNARPEQVIKNIYSLPC